MSPAAGSDVNTAPGHLGFPHARPRLSLTRDKEFKAGGRRLKKNIYIYLSKASEAVHRTFCVLLQCCKIMCAKCISRSLSLDPETAAVTTPTPN